ncbi:hypothetical protein [Paenibacillus nasutitermitis]|uniref:Uncharacterized protein n=1 Tax=Paenibacillus nasutitermitis TaxID=1652958 RepID=A0A916YJV6_9BACL|nr:hypothetical protein [Paenibacillus nasutitermitis]GGD47836.1 hypothetical protein GCM10010911_01710 [Paenibacillus nasutitermitis]
MSRERAASRGVPIYATIEETLTRAYTDGGLDGVIIIGEHGDYPEDQYGRKWYPRRRFFEEVLRVLDSLKETTIPIFSDKHFTYNIEDTVWMYNEILKRNHPFMGGSSIPHAPQMPALDSDGPQGMAGRFDDGRTGFVWQSRFRAPEAFG